MRLIGPSREYTAQAMFARVADFKAKMPLYLAMRNPGLRGRHWIEISKICGREVRPTEGFTLYTLEAMALEQYLLQIEEVSALVTPS
eukprot:1143889-Pyramimonas_sp.AAC.2